MLVILRFIAMKTSKKIFPFILFFIVSFSFSTDVFSKNNYFQDNGIKKNGFKTANSSNSVIVTNTANSGLGSLRQAIINANANPNADSILFNIPLTDPGYDASRGVFRIYVSGFELNPISRPALIVDGFSQTRFTGNTNTALLGSGGVVGVDMLAFPQFDGPEIEIVDSNNLAIGIKIAASSVKVRGLAILGFGNGFLANHANIVVQGNIKKVIIENNVLGVLANNLAKPDSLIFTGGSNIILNGADSGIVRNNLLAWAGVAGIYATSDADCWIIEYNESVSNGFGYSILDGMDFATSSGYQIIRNNKIYNNAANGLDSYLSKGYNIIENNSIYQNGVVNWENSGIRVYGQYDIIRKNVIHSNRGSGILVTSAADFHRISQNSIWGNGAFASNGIAATKSIGINLISSTENHSRGTFPFYTLNDYGDYDIGGNDLVNYPVISTVKILPSSIEIEGFVGNGAEIEFFIGDTLASSLYPQGKTYLFSGVEGSVNDLNSASATYGPFPFNGINQGYDSCNMFKFIFPNTYNLIAGTIITATATVNNRTSEFSPAAKATNGVAAVIPVLDCIYTNSNGTNTAVFGYNNPYNVNVNIALGSSNGFNQNFQNFGQPTVFIPGIQSNVFSVEFISSLSWKLNNNQVIADASSNRCPVDLSVDKKVLIPDISINDSIFKNDSVTFGIVLKNNSIYPTSNIEVLDTLPMQFQYISAVSTKGNYNIINGKWVINYLAAMDSAILYVKVKVDTNGQNNVIVLSQSQPDFNTSNDYSFASVTISNSSGGNDGGLESNGNLASKTASRNFFRHKMNMDLYKRSENLEMFTYEKVQNNKIKTSKSGKSVNTEILNFIPQTGPLNSQAFITTPTDLIGVSNAIEVFSVDYFKNSVSRKAAILAIASSSGSVYEHTKMICDRLDGATIDDIKHVYINSYPFIMAKMLQDNGDVDYAISFIAYKNGNTYTIDNRWDLESYHPNGNSPVLNFQIWSVSEIYTKELLANIISKITENNYSLNFLNNYPAIIPTVYVRKGYYKSGNLYLEIRNNAAATSLNFSGNVAYIEDGIRYYMKQSVTISQNTISEIVLPVNSIFDIGFSMVNNEMGGKDILYYADGPWGLDYEQTGATISDYSLSNQNYSLNPDDYNLGRIAYLEGSVKEYCSLFRVLKVGNKAVDLSAYNTLKFNAFGSGSFEVVVSKKGISQWSNQYKTTINLDYNSTEIQIPFSQLVNNLGQHNFTANDVVAVSFVKKGNNTSFQNFTLSVGKMRFTKNATAVIDVEKENSKSKLNVYPNPFSKQTNINFTINEASNLKLSLYNADGKETEVLVDDYFQTGNHAVVLNAGNLKEGVYIIKLQTEKETTYSKVILIN